MRLSCAAEPGRVKFNGEFTELPDDIHMNSVCPCLMSREFSVQNDPPFEMARRSFVFSVGRGLRWISDAERIWGEHHDNEDGPYMQLFPTADYLRDLEAKKVRREMLPYSWGTPHETAAAPLVGWIAGENEYMIAVGWKNGYQTGARWGPCLHCDPSMVLPSGEPTRHFRGVVYITPVDLDALVEMFNEDLGENYRQDLRLGPNALWPYSNGTLLDGMEGESLNVWRPENSTVGAYESQNKLWTNGHSEQTFFPEGVTEGKGSMLWEAPAGEAEATLTRTLKAPASLSHVAIDAINRCEEAVDVTMLVRQGDREIGAETFRVHHWANRRLLVPLAGCTGGKDMTIQVRIGPRQKPARVALDNLRGFEVAETK
jgi:hypothetical protein